MLIGEVAKRSGVSVRMLRHYDSLGLVCPAGRTAGGYREYVAADVHRLFAVESLRTLGLSLHEIGEALDASDFTPVAMIDELVLRTRERMLREGELLERLERVRAGEPGDWDQVLSAVELLRGLGAGDASLRQHLAHRLGSDLHGLRHLDVLVEAVLSEQDLNTAGALDWALAQAGDDAVPALTDALGDPAASRRQRAVLALRKIATPVARRALASMIEHEDPFVRGWAAIVGGEDGEARTLAPLISLVVSGDRDVEASEALGLLARDPEQQGRVVRAIEGALDGSDADARLRLTQAIAEIPGDDALDLLARLSADPERRVALTAEYLRGERAPQQGPR